MKKIGRRALALMAIILLMAGTIGIASATDVAEPAIVILPDSGDDVTPDGTILVPINQDAFESIGLSVQYYNFDPGNPYAIFVVDSDGVVVYNHEHPGGLPTGEDLIEVHWIVGSDLEEEYTITAEGWTTNGRRVTYVQETAPIEPIPVSPLVLTGFLATVGIVTWRRYR